MDVQDYLKQVDKKSKTKEWVFNPLDEDFTFKYDGKDEFEGFILSIPSCKAVEFPYHIAVHARKILVGLMISKEFTGKVLTDNDYKSFEKRTII